jgi:hypothetical protein
MNEPALSTKLIDVVFKEDAEAEKHTGGMGLRSI